jgi:ABC-type lipoprotein export system ATPase subunit
MTPEQEPLIELRDVSKEYPGPETLVVLKDITFALSPGESVAIVGPSGAGKSTLLNILGALDQPSSGTVRYRGKDLSGLSAAELAQWRNREVGFVFQLHHLLPQCTALENVLIPTLIAPPDAGRQDRARTLLHRVGLDARMHARPAELSGGERQRVALVRALMNRPGLLLADEPTGSLNEEAAEALVDLLLELNREEGMALVMVTHSLRLAGRMGGVLELHDRHLLARMSPA